MEYSRTIVPVTLPVQDISNKLPATINSPPSGDIIVSALSPPGTRGFPSLIFWSDWQLESIKKRKNAKIDSLIFLKYFVTQPGKY